MKSDFIFIEKDLNEIEIMSTPKNVYKNQIKSLINKAAFKYFLSVKETHTKLNNVTYKKFELLSYLASKHISNEEKQLLYKLRSKCHDSKTNFKKLNKNNLKCVFGCSTNEDQEHSFIHCLPIVTKINKSSKEQYKRQSELS